MLKEEKIMTYVVYNVNTGEVHTEYKYRVQANGVRDILNRQSDTRWAVKEIVK